MTLLSVCQDAADLLTIPRPDAVLASSDQQVMQLLALLKKVGTDARDRHDWNSLTTAYTFTCGASNAQSGEPPTDFARMSDGMEMWNDTNNQIIRGPLAAREWTDMLAWGLTTIPQYWRLIGGVLNIYSPSSGDTIRYEYISKYWIVKASDSTTTDTFASDADTFKLPEQLLTDGLVWRWKQAKGLDYAEDLQTYNQTFADAIKADKGGLRTFSTMRAEDDPPPGRIAYGRVTPVV